MGDEPPSPRNRKERKGAADRTHPPARMQNIGDKGEPMSVSPKALPFLDILTVFV
jgi:hypothetical protein